MCAEREPRSPDGTVLLSERVSVFVVAEAGMNHDGNLGLAIRLAEVAATAGADAVKFQLHDAEAETTRDAPSPPYFTAESRWDYFNRTAFSDEQWRQVQQACEAAGIEFLCSAFSERALERLERLGVPRHKIPSGEVTNLDLVRAAAATGKPLLLSSGMSSWAELDAAVAAGGDRVTVLQCTSSYPTPPEQVGLNVLAELRRRYGRPVGLSDHSIGPYAALAGVALGAEVVEKHFTLSRSMYGPDAAVALEPEELDELVAGIRSIERMLANPADKDDVSPFEDMKRVFEKSVVAVVDIPAGTVLGRTMLAAKKPGTGVPAQRLGELVGRRVRTDIAADTVIHEADVE
jgi:N,N'-diacetyllegionaminate synthase